MEVVLVMASWRGSRSGRELFWRGHISRQKSLGVTVRLYCRANDLTVRSFFRWQRRLAEAVGNTPANRSESVCAMPMVPVALPTAVEFAEVRVVDDASQGTEVAAGPGNNGIEVVVSGGRRIRVGRGFDEATFLRVVALLEEGRSC
jgi:hypothetical protein